LSSGDTTLVDVGLAPFNVVPVDSFFVIEDVCEEFVKDDVVGLLPLTLPPACGLSVPCISLFP